MCGDRMDRNISYIHMAANGRLLLGRLWWAELICYKRVDVDDVETRQ